MALWGNSSDAVAARSAQAKLNAMMPDHLAGHLDQALVHARKAGRALNQC